MNTERRTVPVFTYFALTVPVFTCLSSVAAPRQNNRDDANRQRWKQLYYNGSTSETTLFVGGMLEKHTAGGITEYRHTIQAGGQPVALYTRPSSGTITTQYFLLDHLGSVAEITNSSGALDVPENFAAFGQRRDASDWSGSPSAADQTIINAATQRGYTFHTNSEESSLIHMNGRIADALTGRFLSPDPFVFQPELTQSFNRYSYVNNNPLTYTDPSGFDGGIITASVVGTLWSFGKKLFGKKKRPPPKGCFVTGGGTACYGKAVATKLYEMARDIYGLPPLRSPGIWGGTGPCGWAGGCMSFGDGQTSGLSWDWRLNFGLADFISGSLTKESSNDSSSANHQYTVRTEFCSVTSLGCNLQNVGAAGKQYSYPNLRLGPAPFAVDGRPVVVFGPGPFDSNPEPNDFLIPGGRVTQTFDPDTFTIVNTTLDDHAFCCGTITRFPEHINGKIYLTTIGSGTHGLTGFYPVDAFLARRNQRQGPIIFRALDQQAKKYFDSTYGGQ